MATIMLDLLDSPSQWRHIESQDAFMILLTTFQLCSFQDCPQNDFHIASVATVATAGFVGSSGREAFASVFAVATAAFAK